MINRMLRGGALALLVLVTATTGLRACFSLVHTPEGPLPIASSRVKVQVDNVVVRVKLEQTFVNRHARPMDGSYVFPLPAGASVASFAMIVDGKRIQAEVEEKDEARRKFRRMVRDMRNPALLQFLGGEVFRADVGRIPAGGHRVIELVYEQTLKPERGLFELVLPLKAGKGQYSTLPRFEVEGRISTDYTLQNIYSPTHDVKIARKGENRARFQFARKNMPLEDDFRLYFSASRKELGLTLMTHRVPDEDGYFLLMLTPPSAGEMAAVARDVTFVVDVSGSMNGAKIKQARRALKFCLDRLQPEDHFEIVGFSSRVKNFTKGLRPASRKWRQRGVEVVSRLKVGGGTNIQGAMMKSLESRTGERPHLVVFLTDGKPTEGIKDVKRILATVKEENGQESRIFMVGIGYNLDVKLLDGLSEQNRGSSVYVKPDEQIDRELGSWYQRISHPVLTDLALDFGEVVTEFEYPEELPDLFAGDQLLVVGRYRNPGEAMVRLKGRAASGPREYIYDMSFPAEERERDFLARLWAQRRVGYLLDKIRLIGEEEALKEEVIRLSKEFNIATPYTSFLVSGPKVEGAERELAAAPPPPRGGGARPMGSALQNLAGRSAGSRVRSLRPRRPIRPAYRRRSLAAPPAPAGFGTRRQSKARAAPRMDLNATSGKKAVEAAERLQEMKGSTTVSARAETGVKYVGGKTFRRQGEAWIDEEAGDPKLRKLAVEAYSDAYFALMAVKPDLGRYLTLGDDVTVVFEGVEVVVRKSGGATDLTEDAIRRVFEG